MAGGIMAVQRPRDPRTMRISVRAGTVAPRILAKRQPSGSYGILSGPLPNSRAEQPNRCASPSQGPYPSCARPRKAYQVLPGLMRDVD